jgi:hypothetical protein
VAALQWLCCCQSPPRLLLRYSSQRPVWLATLSTDHLPPCVLSSRAAASGPLGLQLKKSASLLDLINSALSSPSDHLSGATAMVF